MKYTISLSAPDRTALERIVGSGTEKARVITRARLLLLSDRALGVTRSNLEIMDALQISCTLVLQTRKRYLDAGLDAALYERPRPGRAPKITGDIEAHITTLACSEPPDGRAHWTLRLLTDRIVELGLVEKISHVAIHKRLKKMNLSLGGSAVGA
jgi:hypothetical protein